MRPPLKRRLATWVFAIVLAALAGWRFGEWMKGQRPDEAEVVLDDGTQHVHSARAAAVTTNAAKSDLSGTERPEPAPSPTRQGDEARWTRGSDEWQGMLQRLDWPCPADGTCGMARACVGGRCVPCLADKECVAGEICALGHCVKQERADCMRRADCASDEALCVLSGYSSIGLRGNEDMSAVCLEPKGESPFAREQATLPNTTVKPAHTPAERVQEQLEQVLSKESSLHRASQ